MPAEIVCYPADWPVFAGHFPGRPIVPGAEIIRRAAALSGGVAWEIRRFKFVRALGPDQPATLQVQPVDGRPGWWQVTLFDGDGLLAQGQLRSGPALSSEA